MIASTKPIVAKIDVALGNYFPEIGAGCETRIRCSVCALEFRSLFGERVLGVCSIQHL